MAKHVPRAIRRAFPLLLLDALSVFASFFLALVLRFEGAIPQEYLRSFMQVIPFVIALYCLVNYAAGLYARLWKYASVQELLTIALSVLVSTGALALLEMYGVFGRPLPLSVVIMGGFFTLALFTIVRYRARLLTGLVGRLEPMVGSHSRRRVLIVGTGEAGQLLARKMQTYGIRHDYELVGFVDDDPRKLGLKAHGLRVLGDRTAIPELVSERDVTVIVLAIHRISGREFRDILSICHETSAQVKILPDALDVIDGGALSVRLKDPGVEDLLGREQVETDLASCRQVLSGKVVLVTGAGGSIGSELCRQILRFGPRWLLMLDNNETALHDLEIELAPVAGRAGVESILADILRREKMEQILRRYDPQVIFHSAAFKHVPKMEENPDEAVWVNIQGTRILTELAKDNGVERFVFISTDKAVNPSSIMGISKQIGELLVTTLPPQDGSLFTAVRFGNVLASRGSVVPTFNRQIEQGGPVTITHPDARRFFMTIEEAASLVIQAAALTRGGDIFVLDMGQEIRIEDLATRMIRLHGLRVGEDVEIKYIGLRPGEKLREELFGPGEVKEATAHPKIVRVLNSVHQIEHAELLAEVDALVELASAQRTREIAHRLRTNAVFSPQLPVEEVPQAVPGATMERSQIALARGEQPGKTKLG